MADIIQLLPDSIANQIAAGEVIQRPASVVKELLENSIDSGATSIKLIIKDSGKTLVQVIDDGFGMSVTDARMAFERHATSKIKKADDLFHIKTMGFRGEALASIAAIAHVELISKKADDKLGVRLLIRGSKVEKQESVSSVSGTSLSVRNLFYKVPARRKFLKSDPVEMKHIMDVFYRVALTHYDIFFSMHHNDAEVYHLPISNARQRIVNIFGKQINDHLIPIAEELDDLMVSGFIGKPEGGKKTKGLQFIFVNRRFIKSNYLHHAIRSAYEALLPKDIYPTYFLDLSIDPSRIDINVHPTKTEIKFEEERLIYNYIRVACRHALGRYSITPVIDFETPAIPGTRIVKSSMGTPANMGGAQFSGEGPSKSSWAEIYEGLQTQKNDEKQVIIPSLSSDDPLEIDEKKAYYKTPFQIHNIYIITQIKSGFLIIDQQAAHERIGYERCMSALTEQKPLVQKTLFPQTIELDPSRAAVLTDILEQINLMGFQIEDFGKNSFIIHGVPAGMTNESEPKEIIENLLEQFSENRDMNTQVHEALAASIARTTCIRRGSPLSEVELSDIVDQLFACENPYQSPGGRKCFINLELDELSKRFE